MQRLICGFFDSAGLCKEYVFAGDLFCRLDKASLKIEDYGFNGSYRIYAREHGCLLVKRYPFRDGEGDRLKEAINLPEGSVLVELDNEWRYLLAGGGKEKKSIVFNHDKFSEGKDKLYVYDLDDGMQIVYEIGEGGVYVDDHYWALHDAFSGRQLKLFRRDGKELIELWQYGYQHRETPFNLRTIAFGSSHVILYRGYETSGISEHIGTLRSLVNTKLSVLDKATGALCYELTFSQMVTGFCVLDDYLYVAEGRLLHRVALADGKEAACHELVSDKPEDFNSLVYAFANRIYFISSDASQIDVLTPDLDEVLGTIHVPAEYGFRADHQPELVGDYVFIPMLGSDLAYLPASGGMLMLEKDGDIGDWRPDAFEGLDFKAAFVEKDGVKQHLEVNCSHPIADDFFRIGEVYIRRLIVDNCRGWLFYSGDEPEDFNGQIVFVLSGLDDEQRKRAQELAPCFEERIARFGKDYNSGTGDPIRLNCVIG